MTEMSERALADQIARSWRSGDYYEKAEEKGQVDFFWQPGSPFFRSLSSMDLTSSLDLAAGQGRHSLRLLSIENFSRIIKEHTIMDVNDNLIEVCKLKIKDNRVRFVVNSGYEFSGVRKNSITSIFCYDAMVHFELSTVEQYLNDARRILTPGGKALFHHSNFDKKPGAEWHEGPHARNFMSARLFAHLANRSGFEVLSCSIIDWAECRELDAISLLRVR
jgi:ubiquinone/menaquinone biosynthesis C-methylase UbiE